MAHHDLLTGLANRTFFAEKVDDAVCAPSPAWPSVCDLHARPRQVQECQRHAGTYGRDELLRETAVRLKTFLREIDGLARLGGDEFAIIQLSQDAPRDAAASLASRIVNLISKPCDIGGNMVSVGTSIGIALAPDNAVDGTDLLKMGAAIVSVVLALDRSLETETVAEGVETEQQFGVLRAAGVTLVRGELFSRPCPVSDLVINDVVALRMVESAP